MAIWIKNLQITKPVKMDEDGQILLAPKTKGRKKMGQRKPRGGRRGGPKRGKGGKRNYKSNSGGRRRRNQDKMDWE